MDFTNNVIIVTGASKGIGKSLIKVLNKYNASVVAVYNNTLIKEDIDTFRCDIAKEEDVQNLFIYTLNKYKKIDAVINLAAYTDDCNIEQKTVDSFNKVLSVNVTGTFLMNKYASKYMSKGSVINISSMDAHNTYNFYAIDYAASKAAIENMTLNFAKHVKNIRFIALAPAWVNTDSVMNMDPKFLKEQLIENNQKALLKKEDVALKIIELMINDEYFSGSIIKMEDNYE